jgi:tRNA A-37 threonylcarbamoyl transferase component Bud32/predicted nucleotidyltransferase
MNLSVVVIEMVRERGEEQGQDLSRIDELHDILSVEEREELLKIVYALADEYSCEVSSCCAYGSKISGYARPDSDYDILLVLKGYKKKIKYVYSHGRGLDASILVVDEDTLLNDATRSMLGEFVVGRLLHPYQPLHNKEYLRHVEVLYKRRVILEELGYLINSNPLVLSNELLIPVEYFLFSKIKKRAKVYPHALYSYIKTYISSNAARNLLLSKSGFIEALRGLEEQGIVELVYDKDYYVRVLKRVNISRLGSDTLKGILAWLVHTYAGRKTLNFLREEVRSKMNRRREIKKISIPYIFEHPSSILNLSEGEMLEGREYITRIAESLGFRDKSSYSCTATRLGDRHAATVLYTMKEHDSDRIERVVIKHYTDRRAVKWIALNLWLSPIGRRYDVSPLIRMRNEYIGIRKIRELGINTPSILGVSFKDRIVAFRYVEGMPLSNMIDGFINMHHNSEVLEYITRYGSLLASIHNDGLVLRDTKPSNVLLTSNAEDRTLYLTDFEQSSELRCISDASWDMVCFIYYSLIFTKMYDKASSIVKAFLDGYIGSCRSYDYKSILNDATRLSYSLPFYPVMTLGMIKVIRDSIKSMI